MQHFIDIIRRELIFAMFDGFCTLKISRKRDFFKELRVKFAIFANIFSDRKLRKAVFINAVLRFATFDSIFVRFFCGQGRFQFFSSAISSWGIRWVAQVLLASPAPLWFWRFSRIVRFCRTPRVDATSSLHSSSILHPKVPQGSTAAKPYETRYFRRFGGFLTVFWRLLGGHLAVTNWRCFDGHDGFDGFHFLLCPQFWCFRRSALLRDHLFENHSWAGLLVKKDWPTAQAWEQDNARDGKKTKLRWTSTKVACYKGCLWQLLIWE